LSPVKDKAVIVNVEKVERLAHEIMDTVNKHLPKESMTAPEVVLALQTVAYHVMKAREELDEELKKIGIQGIAV